MNNDQTALNQIAMTLAKHFDSMYYVEIETGRFTEFVSSKILNNLNIPKQGEDFYSFSKQNAHKVVHPGDLDAVLALHEREAVLKNLTVNDTYYTACRLVIDGKIIHMRHIIVMCEDKKHVLFCMENIESEFRAGEEQLEILQSARRSARLDELTGIKNQKAFSEESGHIQERIKSGVDDFHFGIVMCDVNDLKRINDTRGHSFGDEAIQRACRMICGIYKHSPVFRIGGDEFAVILRGSDYEQREDLIEILRRESIANGQSRSGPVVACGMAEYDPDSDGEFTDVFKRADSCMYENKNELKSKNVMIGFKNMDKLENPITDERKRLLDGMFGALLTIAGEGYVYLNDMKHDYSRWSLSLIDDFGLKSEYMYHADSIWLDYIHPEDVKAYREAVDAVLCGNAEVRPMYYRARRPDGTYILLSTRGFVLSDKEGNPEYFGGIIIPHKTESLK